MTTDDNTPEKPARTMRPVRAWKITYPDGAARLIDGHEIWTNRQTGALHLIRYNQENRAQEAMVINPAHIASIEDVTGTL